MAWHYSSWKPYNGCFLHNWHYIKTTWCKLGTNLLCACSYFIALHSNQNQYNNYVSNEYRFLILLMMVMGPWVRQLFSWLDLLRIMESIIPHSFFTLNSRNGFILTMQQSAQLVQIGNKLLTNAFEITSNHYYCFMLIQTVLLSTLNWLPRKSQNCIATKISNSKIQRTKSMFH